jgi:two-component system NtrC family sensor kinase
MNKLAVDLNSTVAELTLHEFQVEVSCHGHVAYEVFEAQSGLPGVILQRQGKYQGMISRQRFWERLSRAYGRELFLRRPIAILLDFLPDDTMILPGEMPITTAANLAVKRSPQALNEPLVIELETGEYRLLDVQDLLIAQAHIHQLTSALLQEKTRTEMMHTEKLAALGKLMAGVAHEIRNPVNFIGGNLTYLTDYCSDIFRVIEAYRAEVPTPSTALQTIEAEVDFDFVVEDFRNILNSIAMGTQRLQHLVESLRTFSRLDEQHQETIDMHQSIDNTLVILNNRLKAGIVVVKDFGELPPVTCYPGQIGQVFMNLLTNAIDALMEYSAELATREGSYTRPQPGKLAMVSKQSWEPQITIATRELTTLPKDAYPSEVRAQRWISIRIRDNGPGIPAAIQQKVFEEFFTTKTPGTGTGLGLPITCQIVREKHQGQLILRSPCGPSQVAAIAGGTEFEILLPQ